MDQQEFIDIQKDHLVRIYKRIQQIRKDHPDDLLNELPEPGRWSILGCIEHLNLYAEYYLPAFEKAIRNGKPAKGPFKSGWLGGYSAKSMLPKNGVIKNKMKTFKDKDPGTSQIDPSVIDTYLRSHDKLIDLLSDAPGVDLTGTKVSTTLKGLRFRLGDTIAFFVNHEIRHMHQIEETLLQITQNIRKAG